MLHSARQQAPVQGLARWLLGLGMAATLSANVAHGLGHVRALMTLAVRADASCFAATAYSTGLEKAATVPAHSDGDVVAAGWFGHSRHDTCGL